MANYLIYPFKVMNITQNYSVGNHAAHNIGSPKDYPLDEAGADTGRDYFYCPCDEMKVTRLYGNTTVGHHIWLESTSKVDFADGTSDYVSILAVHMDSDDYAKLKVGQTYKRGQAIFREGTTGKATGNHCHFSVAKGKASTAGYWQQNSKGSWVLVTSGSPMKPEQAFYVDGSFTTVKNAYGLKFKTLEDDEMSRGYFKLGDANEGVYALKQLLIQLKALDVTSNGVDDNNIFGDGTKKAVLQVQKLAKIEQDGCAGPVTIKACRTLINNAVEQLNKKISNAQNALK